MKKNNKFGAIYIIIILFLTYIPIIISAIYSFNKSKLSTKWDGFSYIWYNNLFKDGAIFEAVLNSIILAIISCILATLISIPAALIFNERQSKIDKFLEFISNLPIMIPEIILGMAYLSTFSLMRLPFGMLTLIIAHTTFCIPYMYSQLRASILRLDKSLIDAAKDLGASSYRTFIDVTLPQLLPALLSGMLLSFAMSFDDVVISIFVTGPTISLLPVKVYTKLKVGITPEINALNVIIPLILCFILFIKFIYNKIKTK